MARAGFSQTGPKLLRLSSTLGIAGGPVTLSAWAYLTSFSAASTLLELTDGNASRTCFELVANTSASFAANSFNSGISVTASSSATLATNTWYHACAVFASPTSRACYTNGVSKGTNSASSNPTSFTKWAVGLEDFNSSPSFPLLGRLARVAAWRAALDDAEVFMLGQGVDARLIRPAALLFYLPMFPGFDPSVETDLSGSLNNFPVIGTLTPGDGPLLAEGVPFESEWFDHTILLAPVADWFGGQIFRIQQPGWR